MKRKVLLLIIFIAICTLSIDPAKSAGIWDLGISGSGIANSSSSINQVTTPVISFRLPGGLSSSDTFSFNLGGLRTISTLNSNEIFFSGGCSGSTVLLNGPITASVESPLLLITGINCSNVISTITFAGGNFSTSSIARNYEIQISTPNDYGYFYFYIGGENQVSIGASVNYTVALTFIPEKRIPPTNNWSNQNNIQIRNLANTTTLYSTNLTTSSAGQTNLSGINVSTVPAGNYLLSVKGFSHLRKNFPIALFQAESSNSFTNTVEYLLAGDTNPSNDNFVNTLDDSYLKQNIYTSSLKNDLNRDGIVNSLDLSILTYNIYVEGDQ